MRKFKKMRNQKSIVRKAEKAKARRKDYERRRNINANVPKLHVEETKEVYRPKLDKAGKHEIIRGSAQVEHVGNKKVIVKKPLYKNHEKNKPHEPLKDAQNREIGMIGYPMSKKFRGKKIKNKK